MELPPDSVVRDLVERYARLLDRYGDEWGERPLVLPNSAFFPDPFTGDARSVQCLVDRMLEHAGMTDMLVEVEVLGAAVAGGAGQACGQACGPSGYGSGSCATPSASVSERPRLEDEGDAWRLAVQASEVLHPVALTTELARGMGQIFVRSVGDVTALDEPIAVAAELTAVGLGLGTLLLQGAHVYQKGCGGPSVARLTTLELGELALVFALFCRVRGHDTRRALRELELTQREALAESLVWVDSNWRLVQQLQQAPELVVLGGFELEPPRSYLMRLLSRWFKKSSAGRQAALAEDAP